MSDTDSSGSYFTQHINYITQIISNILSTIKTAPQAQSATVSKLFSLYDISTATTNPTSAETTLAVDVRIAGNVIAARHAYGT